MSSPTINVPQQSNFTDLETIMNLVRALVNDSQAGLTDTPGEGQIITDNPAVSPFTQPFLNSSIREVYRELRNVGQPTLIKDNVIVSGLTPMNSPVNGPNSTDPAVQVYLSFTGYFDGVQINPNLLLPADMIVPVSVMERQTGSNLPFQTMTQPQFGLPSRVQQTSLAQWEWRNDSIWFVGSTETRDVRLRYYCALPQFFSPTLDFSSTFVPIIDCTDAVAYKTAAKYAMSLGAPGAATLKAEAIEHMRQLKLTNTRRMQTINYDRKPYGGGAVTRGNDGGDWDWGWGNF